MTKNLFAAGLALNYSHSELPPRSHFLLYTVHLAVPVSDCSCAVDLHAVHSAQATSHSRSATA